MSHWSHNPERMDELMLESLSRKAEYAPGECIICFGDEAFCQVESPFYWIEKRFGTAFACGIAEEADVLFFEQFI